MKSYILTVFFAMLIACALAVNTQKAIIISYPEDTPQSYIDKVMDTIKEAGGVITHEYNLFRGFAAKASESTIETIKAMGEEFVPVIEDDQIVSVDGST